MLLIIRAFKMHFSELYFAFNVIRVFSGAGLIGLLISPFFFPGILYGLPRLPESMIKRKRENMLNPSLRPREKRNHNHFEKAYLLSIGKKADACMKERQPYLQPDCNLSHLAKHANLPVHHLAYYFRETKKQHFTEYRNEWRIHHAKLLITEGKIRETTLEGIGMQSGFTNRNTFLSAFKKIEGKSPNAFAALYKKQFEQND
jgi:AraC-like DNA-binding protein